MAADVNNGRVNARLIAGTRVVDGRALALVDEARRAFPMVGADTAEVLLPDRPLVGRCRVCGETRPLSKEHVPPAAAFNRQTARSHTVEEWFARDGSGELPGGRLQQGGIWGYTLCRDCNSITGHRYADEYRAWAVSVINAMADGGVNVNVLEAQTEVPSGPIELGGDPGPRPGAFVRQILAIMCTLSADYDLAGRHPAIRRLILGPSVETLPEGMSIGLTAYLGGYPRIVGPQLMFRPGEDAWHCVMELANPPLATVMVLGGNRPYRHTFDLSAFALVPPDEHRPVAGRLAAAIGHTMYPGDYRTQAMVDADRATNDATE
jgi:hypothetical protein